MNSVLKLIASTLPYALVMQFALHSDVLHAQTVNIMPTGDSITQGARGQCSYRRILTQNMLNNPSCNVQFVGPATDTTAESEANCAAFDTPHAGFEGRRADEFTDTRITTYANTYAPDYYLVHLGSNDIFQGESVSQIIDDINLVRLSIANHSPNATVLLANVIPWSPVSLDPAFAAFDNPAVDELAISEALSEAIDTYVQQENDPQLVLVDVRSGFNSELMTIDGVHPNDLGEAHIAAQFQAGLEAAGVCDVVDLPTITLAQNEWYQFSLPANPNNSDRVSDVFDNLPAEQYGTSWQVFAWNPNQESPREYTPLQLDSTLALGRAYWVIQQVTDSVTIDMPVDSTLAPLTDSAACIDAAGCYEVALTPQNVRIVTDQAAYDWDMVGNPAFQPTPFSSSRVTTPAAGPCSGESACTPVQALANQVMNSVLFRWNGANDEYDMISAGDSLQPWGGYWSAVLEQGVGGDANWLIAPE